MTVPSADSTSAAFRLLDPALSNKTFMSASASPRGSDGWRSLRRSLRQGRRRPADSVAQEIEGDAQPSEPYSRGGPAGPQRCGQQQGDDPGNQYPRPFPRPRSHGAGQARQAAHGQEDGEQGDHAAHALRRAQHDGQGEDQLDPGGGEMKELL